MAVKKKQVKTDRMKIASLEGLIASVCDVDGISPVPILGRDIGELRNDAVRRYVQMKRLKRLKENDT